ncbi:hypothetical protein Tco_0487819 [Tanacetum coccineum]
MSTPTHFDSEIISQTDGAQSSRVPITLSDDPYMAVRQSHLIDTDTESGPLEDLRETEIPQPLPSAPSLVPPSDDLYLIVRQTHTPATIDTESKPEEAPSETEEFEASKPPNTRITSPHSTSPSDSTTPLSPDHPLAQTSPAPTRASYYRSIARMAVHTQPTLSPGMSARIAEADALSRSSFRKRYRSSYETPSPSSSPTLPIWKRYRGTSELVEDTEDESSDSDTEREGSEDEGPGLEYGGHGSEDEGPISDEEEEEVAPEGQQQVVPVVDTAADEPLGLGYRALRRQQQRVEETPTPRPRTLPSPEWSSGSLPVSPSSPSVPTPVASPVTTPAATIAVDALPPTLFEGYDRDLRELYTRSREVKDEIFSQCYRLRSLKQEQERATVTFGAIWRPVLALESWAGYVDAQRVEMWRARYDDHRLIHDLLVQNTTM